MWWPRASKPSISNFTVSTPSSCSYSASKGATLVTPVADGSDRRRGRSRPARRRTDRERRVPETTKRRGDQWCRSPRRRRRATPQRQSGLRWQRASPDGTRCESGAIMPELEGRCDRLLKTSQHRLRSSEGTPSDPPCARAHPAPPGAEWTPAPPGRPPTASGPRATTGRAGRPSAHVPSVRQVVPPTGPLARQRPPVRGGPHRSRVGLPRSDVLPRVALSLDIGPTRAWRARASSPPHPRREGGTSATRRCGLWWWSPRRRAAQPRAVSRLRRSRGARTWRSA
jgi:hypothetical protein